MNKNEEFEFQMNRLRESIDKNYEDRRDEKVEELANLCRKVNRRWADYCRELNNKWALISALMSIFSLIMGFIIGGSL